MKVLIVGGGGREHALAWKIAQDPRVDTVLAAPGSAGMASVAEATGVSASDIDALLQLATDRQVDLTIVGPEAPLVAGIVDRFREHGLRIFGPDRAAARLEASKAFTKKVLVDAGVDTAAYGEFTTVDAALDFARSLGSDMVVKADGLAAGKGVIICHSFDEARTAIVSMLEDGAFAEAGSRIVVEEFLEGEEASFMALCDGSHIVALAGSQDHKAVFDSDLGPNTGGMGAYSPAPVIDAATADRVMKTVIEPTVAQLASMGVEYRGVLYAGLMISGDSIKVLEYNVRFGDPEAEVILMRLSSSLLDLVDGVIDGRLAQVRPTWHDGAAASVVMAAEGYPGSPAKGDVINGIEAADSDSDVVVFHSGSAKDDDGHWVSNGGRVLAVTARGASVEGAVERAYASVKRISWRGEHHRSDIGHRAIERELGEE